jgi:glyoxylase-like metal-dependent hydrolase (beta-lactamase superfamily II)
MGPPIGVRDATSELADAGRGDTRGCLGVAFVVAAQSGETEEDRVRHDLPVAADWFARRRVADGLTCLWEPHVHSLMQANVWHVRGAVTDLVIDAGLGVGDLKQALAGLGLPGERPTLLVLTHTHVDHMGGAHQFAERAVHAAEADALLHPIPWHPLLPWEYPPEFRQYFLESDAAARGDDALAGASDGASLADYRLVIDALPQAGFDPHTFVMTGVTASRTLAEGDEVDLGDRRLSVLHLPGHSPGSIALWDEGAGALFTGDVIYDSGTLLDELDGSDIADYLASMERLLRLPVEVVYSGHGEPFGRALLQERARAYLSLRG